MNILCEFNLYKIGINFLHIQIIILNILLGNLSSIGEEMFVMWHFKRCELTLGHDLHVMHAYNIGYKMRIE